jgi:hypothetical protein
MIKYLMKLGQDEDDLRTVFTTFKIDCMKKRVESIRELCPLGEELDPKEHRRLLEKYGNDIKESDYEREAAELKEEENVKQTKFEKKEIFKEVKDRQNYNISMLTSA